MKRFIFLINILVLAFMVKAQEVKFEWVKSIQDKYGIFTDDSHIIKTDKSGNLYIYGDFEGTVDFDPGKKTFNLTSIHNKDIFILKLNSSGNFQWAKSLGDHGNDFCHSLDFDESGNIYVTGSFWKTVKFNKGKDTVSLTSNGEWDFFISKLDASGNLIWANSIGGEHNDGAYSITLDGLGNVYAIGNFWDTVDFDPGIGKFNLKGDMFILKLNNLGEFVWAKNFETSAGDCIGHSIAVDSIGNVYSTGRFYEGIVDFNPNEGIFNLSPAVYQDIFILKLDNLGNFIWAKNFGGKGHSEGSNIKIDKLGNVYTVGCFKDTVDFNPDSPYIFYLTTDSLEDQYDYDVFILKLTASGNFLWIKKLGGRLGNFPRSFDIDAFDNIYLTGIFDGTAYFNPEFNFITKDEQPDIFISKFNSLGDFLWATAFGDSLADYASSSLDKSGNLYTVGNFNKTIDFNPGVGQFFLKPKNPKLYNNIFIHKLSQPNFNKKSKPNK